ncbi:MAG: amidohydrolase family protein [Bacteroidota bacterium]
MKYSTSRWIGAFLLAAGLWLPLTGMAQKDEKWNVDDPHGPASELEFTTDEGTWMNLDVSPDGKEIAFDLLGDIYTMPISGGKARCIARGMAWEVQPRFSPDGEQLLFTSDRGGADNIWIMGRDGSDKKQITKENFRLLNNASWHPSGDYFVARKHYTGTRSLGAGEMWMYHITGGAGMQLTKRKNDQQDAGEPIFSPDGQYVYFSEDMDGAGYFTYNKNPHGQIYAIRRYDLKSGELEAVTGGPGGAVRPQPSPDGKYLAFVRRVRLKSVLYIRDLATGEEFPIFDRLVKDQQETWATFGVYPGFQWMPDSREVVIYAEGKFWRVSLESLEAKNIPFEAAVKHTIAEAVKFPQEVSPKTFNAKMIRHATTSPDGKTLVFSAVGHLYQKKLPKGKPERLNADAAQHEYYPAFSPSGDQLVYTTWRDEAHGAVVLHDLTSGSKSVISTEKGFYRSPRFSADGKMIVFERGSGTTQLGYAHSTRTGLYVYHVADQQIKRVIDHGYNPFFSPDGKRIFFTDGGGLRKSFKSVDLDGNGEKKHFSAKYARDFVPSPDGNWIAFTELYNAYVAAFPQTGKAVDLNKSSKSYPVFRVTRDAGTSLHWSGDSKALHWMLGAEYFQRELDACFTFLPGSPDSLPPVDSVGINVGLTLTTDVPEGKVVFKGARIVTMKGDEIFENGDLVVEGNRIVAVGASGEVKLPKDAFEVDASGKTIIPGLVDVHAHLGNSWNGISPQQQWSYHASVAYGVTTTHDPSSNTEMVFTQSEMVKAGLLVGPRIYSTGTILYGADGDFKAVVNSLDDARSHLRRMKAVGAFSVKSYNQPRRNQRQQVMQAARELEMMVYPEGGSFFYHNMTMIQDGHTGVEHSIPVYPVYDDVVKFWGGSKTGYTPTLIVGYGGIWGENYWYQKTEVWKNERLLTYYPRRIIDSRSMRRMMIPDDDFGHFGNAEGAKKIADGGTKVQLGAHGQLHGLGAHWELWMIQQGGFTNHEALRAGTLWGAEYIGMDQDIGSLEPGKLADLVVLDKNPLDNIRHTESVNMVMMNGRLYDAATMDEIGNRPRKRQPFFWELARGNDNFPWHEETQSFIEGKCGCTGHSHQ